MADVTLTPGDDVYPPVGTGGSDNDHIDGAAGNDSLSGGVGRDLLFGSDGNDSLFGGVGRDSLHGGNGQDLLDGGDDPDVLLGNRGKDSLFGGAGDDFLYGGLGRDSLNGGAGNDFLYAGSSDLATGPWNETITGGDGLDRLEAFYIFEENSPSRSVEAVMKPGIWNIRVDGARSLTVSTVEALTLWTGNGDDLVRTAGAVDSINVAGGNDTVSAGRGHDTVQKTWGRYDLDGGAGIDTLHVTGQSAGSTDAQALIFDGTAGVITSGAPGSPTATSGTFRNFEAFRVAGTIGNDQIQLAGGWDSAAGGDGNDTLTGGGGSDVLAGDLGADVLYGGAGADRLSTGDAARAGAADAYFGGAGADTLFLQMASDTLPGDRIELAGVTLSGGTGRDQLDLAYGGADFDLRGAVITGVEHLRFFGAGDQIVLMTAAQANSFDTLLISGGGVRLMTNDDVIWTNRHAEVSQVRLADGGQFLDMSAGSSDSRNQGTDVIGGDGADRILGSNRAEVLRGGAGNDTIEGGGSNHRNGPVMDKIWGEAGDDLLSGGKQAETFDGGTGNDALFGLAGKDELFGGDGDDELVGGLGRDEMSGGAGADAFVFTRADDSGRARLLRDVILDFAGVSEVGAADGDVIDLSAIDPVGAAGAAMTFVGTAAFTAVGQVRAFQWDNYTLIMVNTGDGLGADMVISLFDTVATTLTSADFVL